MDCHSYVALPPMMKASMIPIVITATTGKMTQTIMDIASHQSFPIAISSTHYRQYEMGVAAITQNQRHRAPGIPVGWTTPFIGRYSP